MMSRRTIYLLAALVIVAAIAYLGRRPGVPGIRGVLASDAKFQPLDVQEPQLRLDLLEKLQTVRPLGNERNIFVATPPPPPKPVDQPKQEPFMGPRVPPPPPPVQVPAQFFGYAVENASKKRLAFFSSGDDVLVVAEGDTFLTNYRLIHIGNDAADVEQISSGRHASVPLVQAPPNSATP